jgi:hypothetical protein
MILRILLQIDEKQQGQKMLRFEPTGSDRAA